MNRAAAFVFLGALAMASSTCNKRERAEKAGATASAAAVSASAATTPAEPPIDVSGKWECSWTVSGASGTETWNMFQDGASLRATFTGRDPGGGYSGSMTGTIENRKIELFYKYTEGIQGTISARVSANGKAIDGDETRAESKVVSHYGCNRP